MVDENKLIMFGGQAISDNNMKYNSIMKYDKESNKLMVKQQQLLKPDKFFFNNQNIIDRESNFLYSMGRDFIHKINLEKLSCYIPDVGYVEYYSQWRVNKCIMNMNYYNYSDIW